jgi:hypothetical protein
MPREAEGSDGGVRTHHRVRSRGLQSVVGLLCVTRGMIGGRGQDALAPMDAELNLPARLYSYGLQRHVVDAAIRGSFDTAIEAVQQATGVAVPKRQAEEIAVAAAADFDVFYAAGGGANGVKDGQSILVLTCDGKGVVMTNEGLREATRRRAETTSRKLTKRLSKGEKRNRKRMATVASVYTLTPHVRTAADIIAELRRTSDAPAPSRPRPADKRVWASLVLPMEAVIDDMFEEALRRDPEKRMRWIAVVDGNGDQLRLLQQKATTHGVNLTIVLDIIHVIEYLWKAAHVLHGEATPEAEQAVQDRLRKILDGKASAVAGGLQQSATKRKLKDEDAKRVRSAANYLRKYAPLLRYHEALPAGLPIASGVIEGACRHLVNDRLGITGARWGLDTAEALLRLRALKSSGDLDRYWTFHERQQWHHVHASRYADHAPPSTAPPPAKRPDARRHLRLVTRDEVVT